MNSVALSGGPIHLGSCGGTSRSLLTAGEAELAAVGPIWRTGTSTGRSPTRSPGWPLTAAVARMNATSSSLMRRGGPPSEGPARRVPAG
jgi:hypothetical protein